MLHKLDQDQHPLIGESHIELRKEVREFAEKDVKPRAQKLDEKGQFSVELTHKMGEMGLLGIQIPKNYGGKELDTLSYIIAVEELARIDSSQAATVAAHNSLGLYPIYKYGTDKQKDELLPQLINGKKLWAFGLTEPTAGSDATGVRTKAELIDGKWVVNGHKIFITNSASDLAGGVTLQAVTGEKDGRKELSAILMERSVKGYSTSPIHNKMLWRAADTGKINFDNCTVPEENILGKRGEGAHIMLETLDGGRLSIAAIGLGLSQGAYEMAVKYATRREQFGKPIVKNQAISFKIADMAMKIELARNTLYNACWMKDNGLSFGKQAAMAKLYCSEIAREISDEALQIHGAYGLIKENSIERFYRDQRILQIGEGTSEILRLVISRQILKNL